MAPLDFKHMTSAKYRPGEDDAINYYAQKRKKQYHGNEGKEVKELSMKPDKKLPNLKVPVKGKKGISRFTRKKAIGQAKDDLNASVQSADRKPEKYMKPDGKVGIRMVKTDKEVVKKEELNKDDKPFVKKLIGKLRKGSNTHAKQADDLEKAMKTEVSVLKPTKPTDIIKHAKTLAKNPRDYMMNKKKYLDKARAKVFKMYPREEVEEAISRDQMMRMHQQAAASQKKNQAKRDEKEKKSMAAKADMDMKARKEEVDEALTLQQRMKRSRLMKRLKTRIKIGRDRARRKMANKKTLEKRSMRQARAQLAKKLTRGIPKAELTFARKKEIEKRLEKPALQQRIKRIAKRLFKDVRKKEVQRKKG